MRSLGSWATVFLLLTAPLVSPAGQPAVPSAVSVVESGIWGGGFINYIAKDPTFGSTRFIIGGDTSGFHATSDNGDRWKKSNRGIDDAPQMTIAGIAFRKSPNANEVYAAFGTGSSGAAGILRSTSSGNSWAKVASSGTTLPLFDGRSPGSAAAYQIGQSPRATGGLLAIDDRGGSLRHIYAGTFGDGLMRSDDGGATWTRVALGSDSSNPNCTFQTNLGSAHGCFLTSVVLSPLSGEADTLYVSVHGGDASKCIGPPCGGVFKISGAACAGNGCADATTTLLPTITGVPPVNAEELTFTGSILLCACGTEGFYKKSRTDAGLIQSNDGLAFDPAIGTSYPAIVAKGNLVVLAAYSPKCEVIMSRETCHTVYESTDGGVTWMDIAFDVPIENIDLTVAGTTIEWWEGSNKDSMIEGKSYNASSLALTNGGSPAIVIAGHSGVWKSTTDHLHWQPAVQGIGAITTKTVAADPNNPDYMYAGDADWTTFASSQNMQPGTVVQTETPVVPGQQKKKAGFAIAVDQQDTMTEAPSDVYLAAGHGISVVVGGVYVNPDPTTMPWTSTEFVADGTCDRTTPRVQGVTVGRPDPESSPDVFAATEGCGLYRLRGSTWSRVGSSTDMLLTKDVRYVYAPMSFPRNLGTVLYVLDRASGELWRSEDAGDSWSNGPIWVIPQSERNSETGWIAADPNAPVPRVWATSLSGLHKLTCPNVSQCEDPANWTDTLVPDVPNAGPVAITPCIAPCSSIVYSATRAVSGDTTNPPRLFKSSDGGASWCDVTLGSSFYPSAANFPVELALSPRSGGLVKAMVGVDGAGAIVVSDGSSPHCA
jgi:hypothetical protein